MIDQIIISLLISLVNLIMKKIIGVGAVLGSVFPLLALAADGVGVDVSATQTGLTGIIGKISQLLSVVLPVLIAFAAVWFVYNVIKYTITADEEAKKKAKGGIISGLIGLFIIIAFWGIIGIVKKSFGVESNIGGSVVPCIPGPGVTNC